MSNQQKPVLVVTGASKGIGLAISTLLLEKFNATVVGISRSRTPELTKLLKTYPASLLILETDVSDEVGMRDAIALAFKTYEHIDGLILNAGYAEPGAIESTPTDNWRKLFDVNFFSLIPTIQAALPILRKSEVGGRVIFVSSGAAVVGQVGLGAYSASKAAMNSLCRVLASEEPSIVAVAVRPGQVDTAMHERIRSEAAKEHLGQELQSFFARTHQEGKLVKPEDAGHVIASLALNAPKSLSGQFVSWDSEECKEFRRE